MIFKFPVHAALSSAAMVAAVRAEGPAKAERQIGLADDSNVNMNINVNSNDNGNDNDNVNNTEFNNDVSNGDVGVAFSAPKNPFVPKKLQAVYDPETDVDEQDMAWSSWNSPFHQKEAPPMVAPRSKNHPRELVNIKNIHNLGRTTANGPLGNEKDPTKTDSNVRSVGDTGSFHATDELGIFDKQRKRTPQSTSIHRGLLDCQGYYPLVAADEDIMLLVFDCLYLPPEFCYNCPSKCPFGDTPLECWNTSQVTDMSNAFSLAKYFNEPIGSWETSAVTDMSNMFKGLQSFNQPLDSWDTSSVQNMSSMFESASSFNQPLNSWKTAAVKDMSFMFSGAYAFDQPVNSWDTSSVEDMSMMFQLALLFDQPIDSWGTSAVTNMGFMFHRAYSFNQPVSSWETSAVSSMRGMFQYAYSFNQPVDSWETSSVKDANRMFYKAKLFNQCLSSFFENTADVDTSDMISGSGCLYNPIDDQSIAHFCQGINQDCTIPITSPTERPTERPTSTGVSFGNPLSVKLTGIPLLFGILVPIIFFPFF